MLHDIHESPFARLQGLTGNAPKEGGAAAIEPSVGGRRSTPTDQVSLSPQAQRVAEAAAGAPTGAAAKLDRLPPSALDFEALMQQAEARLQVLMGQLGIERGSDVTIRSDRAGHFTVESDHPKAAELEAAINEDFEMRNALIGAENVATITRIAAATAKAMQAADANPAMTERYYDWVRGVANETRAMPFHFEMTDGALTAGFTGAQGQALAITDGLRLPA